jgi:hypothetical protein
MTKDTKTICDGCKKLMRVRNMSFIEGKYLCYKCRQKTDSFKKMYSSSQLGKPAHTLEQALNRIYEVKTYNKNKNESNPRSLISVPNVLANKKVRLILVDDKEIKKMIKKTKDIDDTENIE